MADLVRSPRLPLFPRRFTAPSFPSAEPALLPDETQQDNLLAELDGAGPSRRQSAVPKPSASRPVSVSGMDDLDSLMSSLETESRGAPNVRIGSTAGARASAVSINSDELNALMDSLNDDGLGGGGASRPASFNFQAQNARQSAAPAPAPAPMRAAAPAPAPAPASFNSASKASSRPVSLAPGESLDDLLADLDSPSAAPLAAAPVKPAAPRASAAYTRGGTQLGEQNQGDLDALIAGLEDKPSYASKAPAPPAPAPASGGSLDDLIAGLDAPQSALSFAPPPQQHKPAPVAAKPPAMSAAAKAADRRQKGKTIGELDDILSQLPPEHDEEPAAAPSPYAKAPAAKGSTPARNFPASDASVDALVNQLSNQLGTVASRGTCAMCSKPIIGDCMEAMGKKFHVDHFVCQSCQAPLGGGVQFYEANGKPNCVTCHKALMAPKCGSCGEAILDRCVTALGKKWHVHHFVCNACQQPFTSQFFTRDGMPYCAYSPRCVDSLD